MAGLAFYGDGPAGNGTRRKVGRSLDAVGQDGMCAAGKGIPCLLYTSNLAKSVTVE